MAIIYSYPQAIPTLDDMIIGTRVDTENSSSDNQTVNFTLTSLLGLIATSTGAQNLQQVTNIGATTTNTITISNDLKVSGKYYDTANQQGTAGQILSSTGIGTQWINSTATGVTSVSATTAGDALDVAVTDPTTTPAIALTWAGNNTQFVDGGGNLQLISTITYTLPLAADGTRGGIQIGYVENAKNYPLELSTEKAFVNVPWTDTVYTLPLAASGTRGGVQIGYVENAKNYPVELSSEKMFVNVPWTDTTYTLPVATNSTLGGVKIGFTEAGKDYPVELSSEQMFVNVPWTDTLYTLPLAADGTRGGVQIGYVENAKNYPVELSSEKMFVNVPWADTDTGVTGVTLTTGTSTGAPLGESITLRELTLTSYAYDGGNNIGYVPTGGTATTYLQGDGNWGAIPTGLIFKDVWDASGGGGGSPDLTAVSPSDGWLYICDAAGTAYPNGGALPPSTWALGDWCIYNGTSWTRVPATNAGVTSLTTTDGTYINLTPNTATTGAVTVTAALSAVDGTSDVTTKFLSKDNTWDVPSYTTDTTYSAMTSTVLGLGKLFSDTEQTVAATAVSATASRTYGVQMNSSDQLVTNVPWTDTSYTLPVATSTILGGIELGSDTVLTQTYETGVTGTASRTYPLQLNAARQAAISVPWVDTQENTTWYVRDSSDVDKTVNNVKYLKFVTATGSLGTDLTGAGSTGDPFLMTLTSPDTNTQNTYDLSVEQNGGANANPILRLTGSGGPDDITITGSGATTVTRTSATAFTINSAAGSYQWKVRDTQGTPVNATITNDEYLQFETATGALGTALTGTGTTLDPYLMTLTSPDTNTTYSVVSTSAAGLAPTLPNPHGGKFLRADATWVVPDYVDPGVTTFTNVNGDFISASTVNTTATGAVTVGTIDLSATGLSGTPATAETQFLRGDNTWAVPNYTADRTYSLSVIADTNNTNIKLDATPGTDYTIQLTAGTFVKAVATPATENTTLDLSASGTPGTTTYLRGDNTWTVPPDTTYTLPLAADGTRGGIQIGYTLAGKNYPVELDSEQAYVNVPWTDTLYSLPVATASTLGGIKLEDDTEQSTAANAVTTTASRTYGLQLNSSDQGVINVPWTDTDTTYSMMTSSALGLGKLFSDTEQAVAGNTVSATALRTYGIQANSSDQLVVNIPWTDTDNNSYINSASFNTGNGILTGTGVGSAGFSVDLDGRYLTSYTETDTLADVTGRGATTTTACAFTNTTSFLVGGSGSGNIYIGNIATNKYLRLHTNNLDTYFDAACGDVYWREDSSGSNGRFKMDMSGGTFTASGDVVAYGSVSDISLKENIKPIENALDKAIKLQGVTFDWKKSDSILDIKEDIGFIAQDVQKVVPELVRENENGLLSLRHQGITPILLEAIKELKAEIEELKLKPCNCNNCNCKE